MVTSKPMAIRVLIISEGLMLSLPASAPTVMLSGRAIRLFFGAWLRRLAGASLTTSLPWPFLLRIIASARDSLSFAAPFPPLMSSSLLSSVGLGAVGLPAAGLWLIDALRGFSGSVSGFISLVALPGRISGSTGVVTTACLDTGLSTFSRDLRFGSCDTTGSTSF